MIIKLFTLILLFVIACCAPKPSPQITKPVQPPAIVVAPEVKAIAIMLPLSGENSNLGNAMLDAGFLALHDAKSDLDLMVIDSTLPPEALRAKIQELKEAGIKIIVGPLFADDTRNVAQMLKHHTILSFSNDSSLANLPGVYLLGYLPEAYVEKVVHEAVIKDINSIYTLLPAGKYAGIITNNLLELSDKYAMELVGGEFYESGQIINATKNIRKKMGTNAKKKKALIVSQQGKILDQITNTLTPLYLEKNNIQLINLTSLSHDDMHDGSLDGAWFVGEKKMLPKSLLKLFKTHPNNNEKFSSLAYEAVSLAILMKSQSQIVPNERLRGINGDFSFNHRRIIQRELVLYRINNNVAELIEQE
jgi:hypothetical protein